jgi:Ca2+-binding EF-hand superfamily protein
MAETSATSAGMTGAQLKEMKAAFDLFDTDGDGAGRSLYSLH